MKRILLLPILCCILLCGCSKTENEYQETDFVLDTVCTIRAGGNDAKAAIHNAFDEIRTIHNLTNYFDPASDVSKINASPAGTAITIDERTFSILETALSVSKASGGAFDPTIAPVLDLWGFGSDNQGVPEQEEIDAALSLVDYTQIVLDKESMTVTKITDQAKIDLGGAVKGYASDRAAEILKECGMEYGVIDLGGNILVFGENPKTENGRWRIGIQKPFEAAGVYDQTIELDAGAVVTSGIYQRNFLEGETLYHHLIDPKTGFPADGEYASVSIQCDSGLLADCLSTAYFVLGPEEGARLLDQYQAKVIWIRKDV